MSFGPFVGTSDDPWGPDKCGEAERPLAHTVCRAASTSKEPPTRVRQGRQECSTRPRTLAPSRTG